MTEAKNYMYKPWWKITGVLLLIYTFTAGLLLKVPALPALQETIRNLYFHVCMWFAMMILFTISVVNAIKYLRTLNIKYDIYQFAPITITCKSYSKLIDVSLKLGKSGFKLDVSYLEDNNVCKIEKDLFNKKFHFLVKEKGDILENDFIFLRSFDILVCDSFEKYYVFYKEECEGEENRDNKLGELGI